VLAALVTLHAGMARQGPGDAALAAALLDEVALPASPRIADLGCGAGAGALMIAERTGAPVTAVDIVPDFLSRLADEAGRRDLAERVLPVVADMAAPPIAPGSLDLLWSEGAAYAITFAGALKTWRPLMAPGGIAVVSELTWFTQEPGGQALAFWSAAYPDMADMAGNTRHAEACGFTVLETGQLSSEAWHESYYGPLGERIAGLEPSATGALAHVIAQTKEEMDLFARHSADYGYVFYVLSAGDPR